MVADKDDFKSPFDQFISEKVDPIINQTKPYLDKFESLKQKKYGT